MRRTRRGGHLGPEFPSSGEDSFVAVVVTKLTGALLFILLLAMVILALVPRAEVNQRPGQSDPGKAIPLAVATPERLPEAILGRPYNLALAATGASGPLHWAVDGTLPEGLAFNPEQGTLAGTPKKGTLQPATLVLRVTDGAQRAARPVQLTVFEPTTPLGAPTRWDPKRAALPVKRWLDHGFGFLALALVYLIAAGSLSNLQRQTLSQRADLATTGLRNLARRFMIYKASLMLFTLAAMATLALWLAGLV